MRLPFPLYHLLATIRTNQVGPPVLLPAAFIRLSTEWPFLAVTNRGDPVTGDAQRDQEVLGRIGTPITKPQVVFNASALVAMSFNTDGHIGV